MKSNKQRRTELDARKQALRDRAAAAERDAHRELLAQKAAERTLVEFSKLSPDGSYSAPEFVSRGYYVDQPFTCCDCGIEQVWTARQQKWWYEVAKGDRWTIAKRCRACRRNARQRDVATSKTLEGVKRKQQRRKQ